MINKTNAIKSLLTTLTYPDLANLYNHDMEVQVNVAKENGNFIEQGEFKGKAYRAYTDGNLVWKPFRIPFNAKTEPTFEDGPMTYPLALYAEGIGMTGWDWKSKLSRWVAFDFDAILGHSDRHSKKLTDIQLTEVQDILVNVPFVTLRKSTSGKGLHLYIFLEPVPTANHTEHAALARAILSMLSGLTGYNFGSKVDTCGGNMWVWHRKMYKEYHPDNQLINVKNEGLQLIKAGEKLTNIPANWRDHLKVISRKSSKALPEFVNDNDNAFNELIGQNTQVSLDCEHHTLIDWLANNGCVWWWDNDNWMLVTHTYHLKEAHTALKLRGQFETISQGSERGMDHNCFAYPLRNGGWVVRRFSPGTQEHEIWENDGNRWTRCYFNSDPDLHTLSRLSNGIEHEKGGYCFRHAEEATKVLLSLGIDLQLPNFVASRKTVIKPNYKENKIIVHIDAEGSDDGSKMKGWLQEKKLWKRVYRANLPHSPEVENNVNYDDIVRHIVSTEQDAGWVLKRENVWVEEPLVHVKLALNSMGHDTKEATQIIGSSVMKGWTLVNKPFQPEYPGNREWNRNAVQLAVSPTQDLDNLSYPNWQSILNHCGHNLNEAIANSEWCRASGINKGSEYLMLWIASLLKQPDQPMTYLAFWGPQDSGKSIFHEAISEILITKGVVRADNALQNSSNFNGELANAILCVVEETELKKDKTAANRIKDWVTGREIQIHQKNLTPYMMPNYLHFVQCSNEIDACPIFEGDTRVTLIYVDNLVNTIPKLEMMARLKKEAPDFLAAVLNIELPRSETRLAVPTLETESKKRVIERNLTLLEEFIKKVCYEVPGHAINCDEFYEQMQLWLPERDRSYWTKQRIGRELPDRIPRGRLASNQQVHYGNLTFDEKARPELRYVKHNLFLKQE